MLHVTRFRGARISAASVPTQATPTLAKQPDVATGMPQGGGFRSHIASLLFLAPGGIWLLIIAGYPLFATVVRSTFDQSGSNFTALNNYRAIFATTDILIAFRNNVIWVLVFPFVVSFLALSFAVLTGRIPCSTAIPSHISTPAL